MLLNFNFYIYILENFFFFFKFRIGKIVSLLDDRFFFNFNSLLYKNYYYLYNNKLNKIFYAINFINRFNYSYFFNPSHNIWNFNKFFRIIPKKEFDSIKAELNYDKAEIRKYVKKKALKTIIFSNLDKFIKFEDYSYYFSKGFLFSNYNLFKVDYKIKNILFLNDKRYEKAFNYFSYKYLNLNNIWKIFFFKKVIFNFTNFVLCVNFIFNNFVFNDFFFLKNFGADKMNFLFIVNFYKDLFYLYNKEVNLELNLNKVKDRLSFFKFNFYKNKNNLNFLENFLGNFFRSKNIKRHFNVFDMYIKQKSINLYNFDFSNLEIRSFNIFNKKFILSLFLKYNLKFFRRFLNIFVSNKFFILYNSKFFINFNDSLLKYFLNHLMKLNGIFINEKNNICINLLVLDRIIFDYVKFVFLQFSGFNTVIDHSIYIDFFFNKFFLFNRRYLFDSKLEVLFEISPVNNILKINDKINRKIFFKVFNFYKSYKMLGEYFKVMLGKEKFEKFRNSGVKLTNKTYIPGYKG